MNAQDVPKCRQCSESLSEPQARNSIKVLEARAVSHSVQDPVTWAKEIGPLCPACSTMVLHAAFCE